MSQTLTLLPNKISGLHIEPTNICTLKCPDCARTRFMQQFPQHWKNASIDINSLMNFLDIDLKNKIILLCGNNGDPIYHPEFHRLIKELKNRGAIISIVTNGSYKQKSWWVELVEHLDEKDTVTFSIDGTPDNFTQYRINGDWESINNAIKVVVDSKVKTIWKYIPFSYNENDIETAKNISYQLGIDKFLVTLSDRFDEKTNYLKPNRVELLSKPFILKKMQQNKETRDVDPICANNESHYISAEGFYSPCCYLADYRFYYKNQFGKNKKLYDIRNKTLTSILLDQDQVEFFKNLDQHPGCQYNCPTINEK